MVALTANRNTTVFQGDVLVGPVGAGSKIFAGAIVMRNAAGYLVKGATATGAFGVGVADALADNSGGADGAIQMRYQAARARFANSASGDLIAQADVGKVCWIVDDQTVAKTNGSSTRSPAGFVESVDALGVVVRFSEAILRAS